MLIHISILGVVLKKLPCSKVPPRDGVRNSPLTDYFSASFKMKILAKEMELGWAERVRLPRKEES